MTRERYERIFAIFRATSECEPGRRPDFLDQVCAGDDKLRQEVEAYLASHEQAGRFMATPALEVVAKEFARAQAHIQGGVKMKYYCPKCDYLSEDQAQESCPTHKAHLVPDPYNLAGQDLDEKHHIEVPVGEGGFGIVYRARHLILPRQEALKILKPDLGPKAQKVIELFKKEGEITSELEHDNIARVYDAGCARGFFYIAMQWLEGHTLAEELTTPGQFNLKRAANILQQIVAALEAVHARDIVHRDLKPSNIFLIEKQNGPEQVKVLDFGIAKVLSDTKSSKVSIIAGTPLYASPEQLRKGANIDKRSDIYSLGVMLYEMLTGRVPFNATSLQELLELQQTKPSIPLCTLCFDAPLAVQELVNRMLAKNPNQRPESASEVAKAFIEALPEPERKSLFDKLLGIAKVAKKRCLDLFTTLSHFVRNLLLEIAKIAKVAKKRCLDLFTTLSHFVRNLWQSLSAVLSSRLFVVVAVLMGGAIAVYISKQARDNRLSESLGVPTSSPIGSGPLSPTVSPTVASTPSPTPKPPLTDRQKVAALLSRITKLEETGDPAKEREALEWCRNAREKGLQNEEVKMKCKRIKGTLKTGNPK